MERAKTPSLEGAPSLKIRKVRAKTTREAMRKGKKSGSGQAELDWLLANPEEAAKILKGGMHTHYFFPNLGENGSTVCLYWDGGKLLKGSVSLDTKWHSYDRVVAFDLSTQG